MITRRGLFGVLAGAVAAPIVVRSGLLMPVKAFKFSTDQRYLIVAEKFSATLATDRVDANKMMAELFRLTLPPDRQWFRLGASA